MHKIPGSVILRDIHAFWRPRFTRGTILAIAISLTLSLGALSIAIATRVLWGAPAGVGHTSGWQTVAAKSPTGDLVKVSKQDLQRMQDSGRLNAILYYGPMSIDAAVNGEKTTSYPAAAVSDNFFKSLAIHMAAGQAVSKHLDGAVITNTFAIEKFGSESNALGKNISIADLSLPIVGVVSKTFHGLQISDNQPKIFFLMHHVKAALSLALPLTKGQIDVAKGQLVNLLPMYYSFVRTNKGVTRNDLKRSWVPRHDDFISIEVPRPDGSNMQMRLGFSALGNKSYVIQGLDLQPRLTDQERQYLGTLGALTSLAFIILLVDLATFWGEAATERINEYKIRNATGATSITLLQLGCIEVMPLAVLSIVITFILFAAFADIVARIEPFHSSLALTGGLYTFGALITPLCGVLVICILAAVIPLVIALRGGRASQAKGFSGRAGIIRFALSSLGWAGLLVMSFFVVNATRSVVKLAEFPSSISNTNTFVLSSLTRHQYDKITEITGTQNQVSTAETPPFYPSGVRHSFYLPITQGAQDVTSIVNPVSPNFFKILGIHFIAGSSARESASRDIVVSESISEALHIRPSELIGKSIIEKVDSTGAHDLNYRIVGVVSNVHYDNLIGPSQLVVYPLMGETGPFPYVLVTSTAYHQVKNNFGRLSVGDELKEKFDSAKSIIQLRETQTLAPRRLAMGVMICALGLLAISIIGIFSSLEMLIRSRMGPLALQIAVGSTRERAAFDVGSSTVGSAIIGLILAVLSLIIFRGSIIQAGVKLYDFQSILAILLELAFVTFVVWLSVWHRIGNWSIYQALKDD